MVTNSKMLRVHTVDFLPREEIVNEVCYVQMHSMAKA
jgi:hypothetical protein